MSVDEFKAANRLAAGRIRATEKMPYLSSALFALTPVPTQGLGTFAVDKYWRMYYDPVKCLEWSIDEIAAVWIHEVNHVFRNHAKRFETQNEYSMHQEWNMAADASINSDLKEDDIVLPNPESRIYADSVNICPSWKKGKTSESLFRELIGGSSASINELPPEISPSQSDNENDDSPDDDQNNESQIEDNNNDDESPEDGDREDESSANDSKDEDNDGKEDETDRNPSNEDEGEAESDTRPSPSDNGEDGVSEDISEDTNEAAGEEDSGDSQTNDTEKFSPKCGSGAGGPPEDYEHPLEDEDYPGIDAGRAEIIKRKVAQDILEQEQRQPGSTPGDLAREASEVMDPVVNWQRMLKVKVLQCVANVMGKQDYSYKRPNRRYSQSPIIFPSLRGKHIPIIYIVIDTSGSMSSDDLGRALSEISSILKRHRGYVYIITCDVKSRAEVQPLIKDISNIELFGGGGTDMRVGIETAAMAKPRPDIILTITDGHTPWPKEPHPDALRAFYIALIVKLRSERRVSTIENKVPSFMVPIVAEV